MTSCSRMIHNNRNNTGDMVMKFHRLVRSVKRCGEFAANCALALDASPSDGLHAEIGALFKSSYDVNQKTGGWSKDGEDPLAIDAFFEQGMEILDGIRDKWLKTFGVNMSVFAW